MQPISYFEYRTRLQRMSSAYPNLMVILTILVAFYGCTEKPHAFIRNGNEVLVHLEKAGAAKEMKLTVITDQIVRVMVSPSDSFSSKPSLMVVPNAYEAVDFNILQSSGFITIRTKSLHTKVDVKTGEVSFTDTAGQVLLAEKNGGGKRFTPTATDGLYAIQQVFESPDDEAFYGLGSHQNRQMNYKGEDVDLVQHNITAVVPFVYSSKNYGLLWDNYSLSKFGDPRNYQPLSSLRLFPTDGNGEGLTARYYVKDKLIKTTNENEIGFEYLETPQVDSFPKDVSTSGRITWDGTFASDIQGEHKFLVYASGYIKMWINNELILDKWRQNWNPWTSKFNVNLKRGEKKTIKIEWIPDGGTFLSIRHLDPLPSSEQKNLTLTSQVGENIDYYFIQGSNADDVISGYRKLTGKAPIIPKWALGFWQSRECYHTQKELIDVVKEFRKRNIPIDNVVLDWQYWEDPNWGSHEFDANRFPDPKEMVNEIHNNLNAHLMISVWPKFNKGTSHYEEMKSQGFLFTRNIDKKRKDWVGSGYESTFYDPFNNDAGKLFWKQIDQHLNVLGIDAWWLDATEPDIHSNLSLDERMKNMNPTALGPGEQYFNAYSLMNAKSVYEGQRKSSPDKRVFILTRSAYGGQQRYGATTWTGDIASTWSDFQDQIYAGINFSLSGIPYWTTDIGGFAVEKRFKNANTETLNEWRELNTRWHQFAAFCPVFRSHGQYPYREIYNIAPSDHPAYKSMIYYSQLRYRLMPYLYTVAGDCYWKDYTMMRGLVMDFKDDAKVLDIGDQYLLGPSLMVNPVYEYHATTRNVYLPLSCGWFNFYTGEFYKGGQSIQVDAPYEQIPLFVKEGSIIPFGPRLQYVSEKSADPITLYVFSGRNATFSLYEDENTNYNYETGAWTRIPIVYEEESKTLTLGGREGTYKNMLEGRTFQIIWVKTDQPAGASYWTQTPQVVRYSGDEVTINLI